MLLGDQAGWHGVLKIFAAGSAVRGVDCLPLAIRQGCLHGNQQVAAVGVGCADRLRGTCRPIGIRGEATGDPWRAYPVGVRRLYDQGRRVVGEEGLGPKPTWSGRLS